MHITGKQFSRFIRSFRPGVRRLKAARLHDNIEHNYFLRYDTMWKFTAVIPTQRDTIDIKENTLYHIDTGDSNKFAIISRLTSMTVPAALFDASAQDAVYNAMTLFSQLDAKLSGSA